MSLDEDTRVPEEIESLARSQAWEEALGRILDHFAAESGIPAFVLETVRCVPVGKGMAGLAVERRQPVTACNIQTDTTGDVRPGARATGLQGSIVVPILRDGRAVGALGIANHQERTFTDAETALLLRIGRSLGGSLDSGGSAPAKP
jgi:GAF domain-containing protein